jgi:hypothetical protein
MYNILSIILCILVSCTVIANGGSTTIWRANLMKGKTTGLHWNVFNHQEKSVYTPDSEVFICKTLARMRKQSQEN